MFSDDIYKFFIEVVLAGGGGALVAYGLFSYLGKKWLENKFLQSLEKFKLQQALQMEQYRFEINSLFNRISKIHEKEFEVLPNAWFKLQESLGKVSKLISPYQEYPDLSNKDEEQTKEILDKIEFEESEKKEILNSQDKNLKYREIYFWHYFSGVRDVVYEFHNYLLYNKIFLSKDLFDCFSKIDNILIEVIRKREAMERSKDYLDSIKVYNEINDEVVPLVQDLAILIQQRLHYQDAE